MQLMQKLPQTTKHSSLAIREAASLLIYTITTLKVRIPDEELHTLIEQQTNYLLETVHGEIVRWIKRKFGSKFGSPVGLPILSCADEELEVYMYDYNFVVYNL